MPRFPLFAASALLLHAAPSFAAVTVDPIFADHMMIQRDAGIAVRGTADTGETVKVSFGEEGSPGERYEVQAKNGRWVCHLPAYKASKKPYEFRIVSKAGTQVIGDVLIGDIWVCAGQSNMEFPMSAEAHAKQIFAGPSDPGVRLLNFGFAGQYSYGAPLPPETIAKLVPEAFYTGEWKEDSPANAAPVTAVGYCFARRISKETGVPVGIVNYAIGGAPVEAFLSRELLATKFPEKMKGDWRKNAAFEPWIRSVGDGAFRNAGTGFPGDEQGPNHPFKPGFAWSAGPARLKEFPITGVLWYQGETNAIGADRVKEYPALFSALVAQWRAHWDNPGLPFYFVQLSSCNDGAMRALWPEFRDMQRRVFLDMNKGDSGSLFGAKRSPDRVPTAQRGPLGMAICSDVGAATNVHPTDKLTVAERLARWALRDVYGKPVPLVTGPVATDAEVHAAAITVRFDHAKGLKPSSGSRLMEFEIAGADGRFTTAEAKVAGDTVVVSAPGVKAPRQVRYGWKPFTQANLVNAENLPASTFLLQAR